MVGCVKVKVDSSTLDTLNGSNDACCIIMKNSRRRESRPTSPISTLIGQSDFELHAAAPREASAKVDGDPIKFCKAYNFNIITR